MDSAARKYFEANGFRFNDIEPEVQNVVSINKDAVTQSLFIGDTITTGDVSGRELPLQTAVIENAVSLASLATLSSPDNRINAILQSPRPSQPQAFWLYQLFYEIYKTSYLTLGKKAGSDNIYILRAQRLIDDGDVERYSLLDVMSNVTMEFSTDELVQIPGFYHRGIQQLNQIEREVWKGLSRANKNSGYLVMGPEAGAGLAVYSNDKTRETIKKIFGGLGDKETFVLPHGFSFSQLTKPDFKALMDDITKAYCWIYKIPPALMNLSIPSHTATSYAAMRRNFVSLALEPRMRMVIQGLEKLLNTGNIRARYSAIEMASINEKMAGILTASQTNCLTRNEILEEFGFPQKDGAEGNQYPSAAGAPPTGENNGQE